MVNVEKMARHSAPEDTRKKNEHRASVLRALLKKLNKCSQGRQELSFLNAQGALGGKHSRAMISTTRPSRWVQ